MPAESEKQRRFMGSELGRLREGKKTRTGMSEEQLEDFAEKPIEKGGPGSGRPKGSQKGSKLAGYTPSGHPQYKMGGGEHINKPRRTGRFKTTYGYAGGGVQKDFFDHMEKTYGFKIEKGGPGSGRKPGHKVARSFDEPHKRGEGVYYPPKLFRGLPSIKDVASGKVKDNRPWKLLNKD